MIKQKLAITGLSGFLGEAIADSLAEHYMLIDLFHKTRSNKRVSQSIPVDLTNKKTTQEMLKKIKPDYILHLAAATHIDNCEVDRHLSKASKAWILNVEATRTLAEYANSSAAHILMLSTECVFSGKKKLYNESDTTSPVSWYGHTKREAEEVLLTLVPQATVLRAAIAYDQGTHPRSLSTMLLSQLRKGMPFSVVKNQRITPTHIGQISAYTLAALQQKASGIFHAAPSDTTSPYDFAISLAGARNLNQELAKPVTLLKFFGQQRAQLRLRNACLSSTYSSKKLSVPLQTISDVFATMEQAR